jgi:hypothetical protein
VRVCPKKKGDFPSLEKRPKGRFVDPLKPTNLYTRRAYLFLLTSTLWLHKSTLNAFVFTRDKPPQQTFHVAENGKTSTPPSFCFSVFQRSILI